MKRTPRILLVEDRQQDIRQVRRALNKLGWGHLPIDVVMDGADAMDFLLRRKSHTEAPRPDLVILDWMLPLKNGIEVLQEMRLVTGLKKIPVVVFSTSSSEVDIEEAHGAGANAYLRKPVDPHDFEETIRSLGLFWFEQAYLPQT